MRVITGELKGRRLKAVPGKETRPTSDKVKEAVFQMMGPFFEGGKCLDLFAGSGALGVEALSRGMDQTTFIDKQSKAIQTIKANIAALKLEDKTEVIRGDAFRVLRELSEKGERYDLILIDPPYIKIDYEKLLLSTITYNLLRENGLIYCEHETNKVLPDDLVGLNKIKQVKYGSTTAVTIYEKD